MSPPDKFRFRIYLGLLVSRQAQYALFCHDSYSCTVRTNLVFKPFKKSGNEDTFAPTRCSLYALFPLTHFPYADALSLLSSHDFFLIATVGSLPLAHNA